jgi:ubiquinone/menaquinone biosynthesis C-methylase UbiE
MDTRKFVSLEEGYSTWAEVYDTCLNPSLVSGERALRALLPKRLKNKKILDVGCGTGRWAKYLIGKNAQVYGIDISKSMLAVARKKVPTADLMVAYANKLPFKNNEFDLAISTLAFDHIKNTKPALKEVARVLKPNSLFFLSMIRPDRIEGIKGPDTGKYGRIHFKLKNTRYVINDVYNKSPEGLRKQFVEVGFELVKLNKVKATPEEADSFKNPQLKRLVDVDFVWIYKLRKIK